MDVLEHSKNIPERFLCDVLETFLEQGRNLFANIGGSSQELMIIEEGFVNQRSC
jgi:hypothetical protein